MFCGNCGKQLEEAVNFCPVCGYKITELLKNSEEQLGNVIEEKTENDIEVLENENLEIDNSEEYRELNFYKHKMFSYMVYKRIQTNVKISSKKMLIYQEISPFFGKTRITEKEIFLDEIKSVTLRTSWDFWDALYAGIFVIFGFFNPLIFLLALLFGYCGYGKKIEIQVQNGTRFVIPSKKKNQEVSDLLSIIKVEK